MITTFKIAPALCHFNDVGEVMIDTDTSDGVSAGVLSQFDDEGVLHSLVYFSTKDTPSECNYDIYDKELMDSIKELEEWKPECEGVAYPVQLITDHKHLT